PVRRVRAPGRAHRARRGEAAQGIPDQRRHLRDRAVGGGHDAAGAVRRRAGADPAAHRPGRARRRLRDPRVLARRGASPGPREGQSRRGRRAPGLTRRTVVLPELVARWGRARLAFCPERTIQGQALRELEELPQVVGGLDEPSRAAAEALFRRLTTRTVSVSSLEAAEMVKLINNCHTDLIYSYGNEVALMAERMRLDPLELIRAANLDYPRPDL